MLIHAVAVGGAVVAGQRPSGVLQCLSGTVPDVLQDIAGVVQQAAIGAGAVVGSVMIGPIIVGTVVDASVAIVGSRGAVVSGGGIPEILSAAAETVRDYYFTWQGTLSPVVALPFWLLSFPLFRPQAVREVTSSRATSKSVKHLFKVFPPLHDDPCAIPK